MVTDWRSTLGVMSDSTPEEVRAAYITRAAEAEAPGRFESVNRAFLAYCQERLDAKTAYEGGGVMALDASEVYVDWKQAELNGFSYCFHRMDGGLCGRAERWPGHHEPQSEVYHPFVKISTVFALWNAAVWTRDEIAKHALRLEARIEELERMVVFLSDGMDATVGEGDMLIGDNFYPCDGTPASILAAVAKAMKP